MDATEICFTPATQLSRLIRAKDVSPVEIADAVLARIERVNPLINAYLTVTADLAREQAKAAEGRAVRGELLGPLDGIPYSLKDLEQTAGIRTTFGSKFFEHNVPTRDGAVASRLKTTGAVLLGKGNVIGFDDLPSNLTVAGPFHVEPIGAQTLKQALEGPERQIILELLEQHIWNRHATAEALGINRTTLYKKMKKLGLEEPHLAAR